MSATSSFDSILPESLHNHEPRFRSHDPIPTDRRSITTLPFSRLSLSIRRSPFHNRVRPHPHSSRGCKKGERGNRNATGVEVLVNWGKVKKKMDRYERERPRALHVNVAAAHISNYAQEDEDDLDPSSRSFEVSRHGIDISRRMSEPLHSQRTRARPTCTCGRRRSTSSRAEVRSFVGIRSKRWIHEGWMLEFDGRASWKETSLRLHGWIDSWDAWLMSIFS